MLYSWSLLRNNNMSRNLQMFTSSYGSRRFAACDQGSHWGIFHPHLFFSRHVCVGYYEKSCDICVFWSDKLISNFNLFNNIKITLHYTVYMCTSDKVHISDEAQRVQSVSYSHIRSLSGSYTVVWLKWRGPRRRNLCWGLGRCPA